MKEKWVRVGTQKQLLRKLPQLKRGYKVERKALSTIELSAC